MKKIEQSFTLFLIGATGDLSKKKTLKAIYELFSKNLLPKNFTLIGNARKDMTRKKFQNFAKSAVRPKNPIKWRKFSRHLHYISGDATKVGTFQKIKDYHSDIKHCGNHLWHISTLPKLYLDVVNGIKSLKLNQTKCGWTKLMLEKPFGTDLESAKKLNEALASLFEENQIYRIDHFLAKETVQNLLAFRFANGIFEHLWSKKYIDHIQITSSETIGIEKRGKSYDLIGATKDVIQNHVLQMLATTMMEEPTSMKAKDVRRNRKKLLSEMKILSSGEIKSQVALGQYEGYKKEANVAPDSKTETAVAIKCSIDNERWENVPIYIRAGKKLKKNYTEISIQFKKPPGSMFGDNQNSNQLEIGNILTFRIQPNEGIVIRTKIKKPGLKLELEEVPLQFYYRSEFTAELVNAYEKLIHDAINGDPTLFALAEGVESSWKFVQPIIDFKNINETKVEQYKIGTWGPKSFETIINQDGRKWITPIIKRKL